MKHGDRTVHGRTPSGNRIVRYDRAGKWFVEDSRWGTKVPISLAEAVEAVTQVGSFVYLGQPGGKRFDAAVRKYRTPPGPGTASRHTGA